MKKLLESLEKGIGQGLGLLIIFTLAFGVYAFVEPSSGPSTNFYFNQNSPLISNDTVRLVGYSTTSNASIGGIEAALDMCDSLYSGSRPAGLKDIVKLGKNYNYTYSVWLFPDTMSGVASSANFFCSGFNTDSTLRDSAVLFSDGTLTFRNCANSYRFACVVGH